MKRFAFSLQRMLGFKKTLYDKERNTLAQMRAARNALEKRREDTRRQMLQMDADFREKAAGDGVRIDEVRQVAFHRDNGGKLVKQLDAEIARMEVEIERQLQVVIALDKEVQSLEKLREKQREEYRQALAREENERILELVSARFVDNQRQAQEEEARAQ